MQETTHSELVDALDAGTLTGAQRVQLSSLLDVIGAFARSEAPTDPHARELRHAAQWAEVEHWYQRLLGEEGTAASCTPETTGGAR